MSIDTTFGSDNHSGVHPRVLEAIAAANARPGRGLRRRRPHRGGRGQVPRALRQERRRLHGLQRHRGQRGQPLHPGALLPGRDLLRARPHQRRRVRRPRERHRLQAAHRAHPGRQDHLRRHRPPPAGAHRPAPRPARGRLHHPAQRAGHRLRRGRGEGHRRLLPPPRPLPAHGRRPTLQRRRLAWARGWARSAAAWAWTSSPSAAPRTACCWARRSSASTPS